jgi:hypothetical protein
MSLRDFKALSLANPSCEFCHGLTAVQPLHGEFRVEGEGLLLRQTNYWLDSR